MLTPFVKPDEYYYKELNDRNPDEFTKPRLIFTPTDTSLAATVVINKIYLRALIKTRDEVAIGMNSD